eukprot:756732-Hanusia_phi.AAC.15
MLGQKSYNGVATLSKHPITHVEFGLKGSGDVEANPQARYIQCRVQGVTICNLYHPNGNPVASEKFDYRLRWSKLLHDHVKSLTQSEMPFVLMGDFNTVPRDEDCYDAIELSNDAVLHLDCRSHYRSLLYQVESWDLASSSPLILVCRVCMMPCRLTQGETSNIHFGTIDQVLGRRSPLSLPVKEDDFLHQNKGMRIDHILLSPQLADHFVDGGAHKEVRGWPSPSDHVPVWAKIRYNDAMNA